MGGGLIPKAEEYLGRALALADFRIVSTEQISGNGLSRTVIKLTTTSGGRAGSENYVLLLEQASSPVAPNRDAEFGILRALAGHPQIKVPTAYWVEADPEPLGAPFLLLGLLPGTTNPNKLLEPELRPHARRLMEESFSVLGNLAAVDVGALDLGPAFTAPKPEDAWRVELARCETIISDCRCAKEVVTKAALRFLHRVAPPPPAKLSVVHGDYRLGNYLFEPFGLTGIIDWEMVHLGDGIEDLAWSLLPLWEYAASPGRPGGVLCKEEAVAAWEVGSGLRVDPASLTWWTIFCHIKAISIWATARHMFDTDAKSVGIMPGLVGYAMIQRHEAQLVELLRGVTL